MRVLILIIAAAFVLGCTESQNKSTATAMFNTEKSELIAFGAYPDYHYNLAGELMNCGRTEAAIQAFQNCIAESKSQTFREDAMFNLSMLYFDNGQDSAAYRLMDTLIGMDYTWLNWYKQVEHPFAEKEEYTLRLQHIDSIGLRKADPANCKFHYQDVANFVTAFEKSQSDWAHAPAYFYRDYFSQASKALFFYQKFKIQSSSHQFAYRVEDKQQYFASILPNLQNLESHEATIRGFLHKFDSLYPPAIFPDIYYTVGCFNSGGTSSPFGLIIGAEMHTKNADADLTNFSNWEQKVVRDIANLPLITIHELVHIQQNDNYDNLLGNAIYEGAADFVSALVCGDHINTYVHDWANGHEAEVWADFQKEMYTDNTGDWIGNADQAKDKPADLGYYVGYKICESYYNKQQDKSQAIADILAISDWNQFYLDSGYMR